MAYYDLEEQEQISELRAWWRQWGALSLIVAALALAGVAGFQGWQWYKAENAAKAAVMYAALTKTAQAGDSKKARETATALIEQYPSSGYAPLAALVAARLSFDAADLAAAKQHLQWVLDKSKDQDFKAVARLRLANVLLDEKQFDAALALLETKGEDAMANLFEDLRGDVLVAKGALADARKAYLSALEKTDTKSPYRNLIQMKIDALGESK